MSIPESVEGIWKPPNYSFDDEPIIASYIRGEDIARVAGPSCNPDTYFWRNIAWSPDGTHLLGQSDDHHLNLFRLDDDKLEYVFSVHAPTTLLSFAWYPFARQDDPQTWCFAIGARDVTIKLIDAYQGRTRATYGIIDHTERFKGPQSMAFSLDGTKLYCAHDSFLSIASLDKPGVYSHTSIRLTPSPRATRKGKAAAGQKGVISTITVTSDHLTGSTNDLVAIGTFAGTVGIYQIKGEAITDAEQLCLLGWKEEGSNGIAQIAFHPPVPHILFVTSRRASVIRAYDLRYVGSRRSFMHPAAEVALIGILQCQSERNEKRMESQQRIHFHLDWAGRYLISGNKTGEVCLWDVRSPESELETPQNALIPPLTRWKAAEDAIPAVAFHPSHPVVVVASGSRFWKSVDSKEDDVEFEDEKSLTYTVPDAALRLFKVSSDPIM
ncbi:WD40 repeat-like protein [Meira miltonrushii]|uniref:WD40 repeat-like protein n=1 Tax=Meira miltonrushii TaxID=1280837 RepID=A0A316VG26_9BASI|nr:WD40 repeat-like protein [Meira miltonrushii]PWN34435.1 WD40 repeat-like protein [Meira miltonrushii]